MPSLHPTSLDHLNDIPQSEREVFDKLKVLDDSYHVFHSITWSDSREGECDFIIFHQYKGFIALEVKGGTVEKRDNQWYSTSKSGYIHVIKNLVGQAQRSMRALRDIYEERYGTYRGIYSWTVCFTDIEWTESRYTLDLHEHIVLDNSSLNNVSQWIDEHFSWRAYSGRGFGCRAGEFQKGIQCLICGTNPEIPIVKKFYNHLRIKSCQK